MLASTASSNDGGSGSSGVYNAISPSSLIAGVGSTPVLGGSSYIQSVSFAGGQPVARAVVTYSLSSDPANPHYADMTQLFSSYGWVTMPFTETEIKADPNLRVIRLMYFDEPDEAAAIEAPPAMRLVLSANGLAVLALGLFPAGLIAVCARAIQ